MEVQMSTEKFKWQGIVSKYAYPETWRSLWQVANSVIPFVIGWYLMYRSLAVGYWLTLLLAIPTAGSVALSFFMIAAMDRSSRTSRPMISWEWWSACW
jgi:fatty acid desaturase